VSNPFDEIDNPQKLKLLKEEQLSEYADWLRQFLIEKIVSNGGHFAANLGVVELSIALHYVYEAPKDILIWDVGHQAYAHKVLTGRKHLFDSMRQLNGISGFPKMTESEYDAFGTAHSSTSISAALGYATAALLMQIKREHVAIIGDGAMSAGQAFEAINNAASSNTNITIIINDNHIGIDPSQGALGEYLEQLDHQKDSFFTDFGIQYFGPVDGHKLPELIPIMKSIKTLNGAKILHIRTTKGKGFPQAEAEQTKWHSTSKYDKLSPEQQLKKNAKFQDVFGKTLLELAEKNNKIVAVTPAMISGSSLHFMQEKFPDRVFDVGIAEQHAVTFSAGLEASGLTVVCCIYSTFLQRGYDQLIHDVALQNLPVIFAIDRAGLVGEDGPTHHGVFDVSFLQCIPNLRIISPRNQEQLRNALYTASVLKDKPTIIRYPRGNSESEFIQHPFKTENYEEFLTLKESSSDVAVLGYGPHLNIVLETVDKKDIAVYDLHCIKPLPLKSLKKLFERHKKILLVEDVQHIGGVASSIHLLASELNYQGIIKSIGIKDEFTPQGKIEELYDLEGIGPTGISDAIEQLLKTENTNH
jgi:1-deoxy-D-xylulose-5-phosphate synthase